MTRIDQYGTITIVLFFEVLFYDVERENVVE